MFTQDPLCFESQQAQGTTPPLNQGNQTINGLSKLALAIIHLLHELLERQAIRRMEAGTLTDDEVDRVGSCLMQQSLAIDQLCAQFGFRREELGIDLGPLGKLV